VKFTQVGGGANVGQQKRDEISLWRDSQLHGGMEILQATCYEHSYPPHFHDEFVIAAFARGAQRTRVCRQSGIAAAGSVMIIAPGEVHTGEQCSVTKAGIIARSTRAKS